LLLHFTNKYNYCFYLSYNVVTCDKAIYITSSQIVRHLLSKQLNWTGLIIISGESPDTISGQIHFRSVMYCFCPVKSIREATLKTQAHEPKLAFYISKKLFRRAYNAIKIYYNSKMKMSLCVLIGTVTLCL